MAGNLSHLQKIEEVLRNQYQEKARQLANTEKYNLANIRTLKNRRASQSLVNMRFSIKSQTTQKLINARFDSSLFVIHIIEFHNIFRQYLLEQQLERISYHCFYVICSILFCSKLVFITYTCSFLIKTIVSIFKSTSLNPLTKRSQPCIQYPEYEPTCI